MKTADAAAETFDTLLADPSDARRWHTLFRAIHAHPGARELILGRVEREISGAGRAGFLRASLLFLERKRFEHLMELRSTLGAACTTVHDDCMAFNFLLTSFLVGEVASHKEANVMLERLRINALFAEQARSILALAERKPPVRRVKQRIALVAPTISRQNHPPTKLVLDHAKLLHADGWEVKVFSPQERFGSGLSTRLAVPLVNPFPAPSKSEWVNAYGRGTPLWLGSQAEQLVHRWAALLEKVAEFAPDVVLCVTEQSVVPRLFLPAFPTLVLTTVGFRSWGAADVWLNSKAIEGDVQYRFRSRFEPASVEVAPCSRASLGTPSDALLLVTAGNRLASEISGDWAAEMRRLLEHDTRLHWLLIGSHRFPASLQGMEKQVTLLKHRDDLPAVLKACDVFVNPPRTGGGGSVAMAMACGLPVVSRSDSDGGDKVGHRGAESDASFFDTLRALLGSAGLRQQRGQEMKAEYWTNLDLSRAGPSLLSAIRLAKERFEARMTMASNPP